MSAMNKNNSLTMSFHDISQYLNFTLSSGPNSNLDFSIKTFLIQDRSNFIFPETPYHCYLALVTLHYSNLCMQLSYLSDSKIFEVEDFFINLIFAGLNEYFLNEF